MQYTGGKSRIARPIAEIINTTPGWDMWGNEVNKYVSKKM